jgi:sugar (pentulose or hexulose) kinase
VLSRPTLVAGLDLGSTGLKILVTELDGREVLTEQVGTPWRAGPAGTTELDAGSLLAGVRDLLGAAAARLTGQPGVQVASLAVSGMGETGMLVDRDGQAAGPAFAWFDPRGAEQAAAFPAGIRDEFAGRTGLPLGAQVSVAKLAYLRDEGLRLRGLRWLNLPEFVAMALGGETLLERSLTSRTGLLDQDTGEPWPAMLAALGVDATFLPDQVDAGTAFGRATRHVPGPFADALITVAGHDHLVAAEADGQLPADHYHVSMGTAEVLLRIIDEPLGYEARTRLAGHLINEVRHVVPGKHVLVAGVKTGLLLRRALLAAGIHDRPGRDHLDAVATSLPYEGLLASDSIEVSGARNDDGVLKLTLRTDGATPAEIFNAVLRHSNAEISTLVAAMDSELPPARTSTLTGGWADMASVRRARALVLPQMRTSQRQQETAYGASRVAARLLGEPSLVH